MFGHESIITTMWDLMLQLPIHGLIWYSFSYYHYGFPVDPCDLFIHLSQCFLLPLLVPVRFTLGTCVKHHADVIMTMLASQITSLTVVYTILYSGVDQRKHQSSASRAFVRGINRDRWIAGNSPGPVNSPHKGPVTRKMFPFDDVIMIVPCHAITTVSNTKRMHNSCNVLWFTKCPVNNSIT